MVKAGSFREDLYYRLNVLSFTLPPLRERRDDLKQLIPAFWTKICSDLVRRVTLAPEAMTALLSYDYPGNIRELRNLLERAIVLGPSDGEVSLEAFPQELDKRVWSPTPSTGPSPSLSQEGLEAQIAALEYQLIDQAMKQAHGNQVKAAELLKLKRGTLQYKLKKYGLIASDDEAA